MRENVIRDPPFWGTGIRIAVDIFLYSIQASQLLVVSEAIIRNSVINERREYGSSIFV